MPHEYRIATMPGDGVGSEVMDACLELLGEVTKRFDGLALAYDHIVAGAAAYRDTGVALSDDDMERAGKADAVLFGAMGLPDVRYPDGTEIAPQLDLRFGFELYAGVRPVRRIKGAPSPLADARANDMDFVIVRESTEGLFASRGKGEVTETEARDTMVITRSTCEKLFDFCFRLARQRASLNRPSTVTSVDKANVFRSMAFWRKVFDEQAARFPDVTATRRYVDATAMDLVVHPWDLGVLVMENMYGDILSDLGAGLVGGMGYAPSADIGDDHAVFQPCHGSAPDIAGQGVANPTAMFLSGAMMLEWLGERHGDATCAEAARRIVEAVDAAFAPGDMVTCEFGGDAGTRTVTDRVLAALP